MPKNSEPRSTPIQTSVAAAFFDSGRRNAGTPFEIASTPVSATAPDEKPFSSRKMPSEPPLSRVPSNALGSNGTGELSPKNACDSPSTISEPKIEHVDVRRDGEDAARLLDAAHVHQGDERR